MKAALKHALLRRKYARIAAQQPKTPPQLGGRLIFSDPVNSGLLGAML